MEPRYFAKINENGIVESVVVAENYIWCCNNLGGDWVETFMGREDKKYAAIGDTYDRETQNFIPPQPFESWTLNEKNVWVPPVPYPNVGKTNKIYTWDENNKIWEENIRFQVLNELLQEETEEIATKETPKKEE